MFKVFNRCLTSRTSGHDQTKINILQIFHAVIDKVHVDYANLLWWDFLHFVLQKKNITDNLLTDAIRDTQAYRDYVEKFERVVVPTIQPVAVESTQGMNRTTRATRTPNTNDVVHMKRKGEQAAEELSSLRKSLKI
ncbi:hypothetical protein Tco_0806203 [Tanacetum coccineum]